MIENKFNWVGDAQFGSTGKGAAAGYLAAVFRPQILSTTNAMNAGHTVRGEKFKHVAKVLPSPSILNKECSNHNERLLFENYNPIIAIGAGAAFGIEQLFKEYSQCRLNPEQLKIHGRAAVITENHIRTEIGENGTKHLASTMQGCGACFAEKLMRGKHVKLARDYDCLKEFILSPIDWTDFILGNQTILHEGSQGFSLDINHGHSYPYCTSRSTTVQQSMSDMGIPANKLGDVYLTMRSYPIRVGNVIEHSGNDTVITGYSGDCYDDQSETWWETIGKEAGMPQNEIDNLTTSELTTVTKRLRRCFTFSKKQVQHACKLNGATKIILTFADYIDWSARTAAEYCELSHKVRDFVKMIEDTTQVPVKYVSKGPKLCDMLEVY